MNLDIPRDLYNFRSNYLDLEGIKLHYLDEGSGDPVVMLHGNPSWSIMYRGLVRLLRNQFRVIVPDHIGCGLSDKPSDDRYPYILKNRIRDLETLLNSLKVDHNITLVMHDWGGLIGMGYATRFPDRIKNIILFNTAAFHVPPVTRLHWSIRICRRSHIAGYLIRRMNLFARLAGCLGCRRNPMTSVLRNAYLAPYDSWENRIAIHRFVQDIPLQRRDISYDLVSGIEQGLKRLIDKPTLICWGDKDFVFDKPFLNEWCNRFPNADVRRFPEAGHYVLEDAFDLIIPIVSRFLLPESERS